MNDDSRLKLEYKVAENEDGLLIKNVMRKMHLSSRLLKKLKFSDRILLNGMPARVTEKIHCGDILTAVIDTDEECDISPEDIKIEIIYEDNALIVLNKQPGIVVHPTRGHPSGTIANGIMKHFQEIGICRKIRPVSRLDRDTSGIIIFAKNEFVQEEMIKQMKDKSFKKAYLGIVHGIVEKDSGTIDLPIARNPDSIMLRHVDSSGANSITHYEVLERLQNATLMRFILDTGRTHQIRVHCQAIGHPLIGDTLYGFHKADLDAYLNGQSTKKDDRLIDRQCLHSQSVSFCHPITLETMELSCDVPDDFNNALNILKKAK